LKKEFEMNCTNPRTLSALFVASLLVAAPAMSAGNYAAVSQLPPEQKQGNVIYLSGGIGQDAAAAMRREESKFPLTLEFVKHAKPSAEYLSGVNVTIKDHQGTTVLTTVADGPFLLAKLPDGKYTVTADHEGQKKERNIVLAEQKQERFVFEW
jgi:hypothetical protein